MIQKHLIKTLKKQNTCTFENIYTSTCNRIKEVRGKKAIEGLTGLDWIAIKGHRIMQTSTSIVY